MTYQITYNYTDECGNEVRDIPETYEGSWEGLQGLVKQMREGGCYDIHADAVDDYEEEESGMNWKNWMLNHLTDIPKIGKCERGGSVFYEYKMTQDDNDAVITDDTCEDVQEYIAREIVESLIDMFRERNPQYEDENPNEDIVESICGAVWELVNAGTLYAVDAQTVSVVAEYHAENGETYCIIKDERGYAAINRNDIQDGIVTLAYTAIDACAADTMEETLKILCGRIKVKQWRDEGLSDIEIAKLTKAFYESGE